MNTGIFNIALAGAPKLDDGLRRQLDGILGQIREGLPAGEGRLRLAVSPAYASPDWRPWVEACGCPVSGFYKADAAGWDGAFAKVTIVEDPMRDALGETLCDRADLLLAVWSEDATELDGATWELMRIALRKRMPCAWISGRTGKLYWQERTVYDTYDPKKLRALVDLTVGAQTEPDVCARQSFPLLGAGRFFYRRFLSRYRAKARPVDAREDVLLRDDYHIDGPGEQTRRRLLEKYRAFDSAAIEFNDRYQSALYWRAVLPFVTSLFIALGFYATNVLGALPYLTANACDVLAGCGFLCHGLLNLYVYLLSRSALVRADREGMVRNRQMAEMLRVLIHFAPFGIHLDLRQLCGEDRALCAALRRILREAEPETGARTLSRRNTVEAFGHVDEMLSDQIAYHRLSRERYARVVNHLERWSKAVFYAGFVIVVLRACLQFTMSVKGFTLPAWTLNNQVSPRSFISGVANMMALLTPAWYSFFAAKLSLCNFRYNLDNHSRMLDLLTNEQDNFDHLRASADAAPAEALRALGESIAEIMVVRDTALWAKRYAGTKIDHL